MAFDDTGYILIIMEDREVKKLVGKSVFQIGEEVIAFSIGCKLKGSAIIY